MRVDRPVMLGNKLMLLMVIISGMTHLIRIESIDNMCCTV